MIGVFHQLCTVPFDSLSPDKSIFVGLGLNFGAIDILHVKVDEAFRGKDQNTLFISSFNGYENG